MSLRADWWLLTIALICALTATFCVLIAQALVQNALRDWHREKFKETGATAELKVFAGRPWFQWPIRLLVIVAFLGTVAGIAFINAAASRCCAFPNGRLQLTPMNHTTPAMTTYPFAPRPNPDGTTRAETDEEFRERVIACLEELDPRDRGARAERHIWMGKHHVRVNGPYWERSETSGVMQEARASYVHGNFISTLVLARAYVEHVINDALPQLPPGRKTPPMAAAIKQARVAGLFPDDLLDGAAVLSDFRNPFMHRRDQDDPDTIGRRVRSRKSHPRTILEQDARDALQVMYGFFRHSFDPPLQP